MAKQIGAVKIRGSIGDITYAETKDGLIAKRRKKTVTRKELDTNPNYRSTLNAALDFGTATRASSLLRKAASGIMKLCADKKLSAKLTGPFVHILKTDAVHQPGEKKVRNSDISSLKNFQFNDGVRIENIIGYIPKTHVDRKSGEVVINVQPFTDDHLKAKYACSHFIIHSMVLIMNFEERTFEQSTYQSPPVITEIGCPEGLNIQHNFYENSTDCMICFVGIRFYDEVNDQLYVFADLQYNTLSIVHTENALIQLGS